jgi:hypothetical protein
MTGDGQECKSLLQQNFFYASFYFTAVIIPTLVSRILHGEIYLTDYSMDISHGLGRQA